MPAEHVDRATLPEHVERDFERGPPTFARKESDDPLNNRGMRLVEEKIEALASPANPNVEIGAERRTDPFDSSHVRRSRFASPDLGHERSRNTSSIREIDLPPPESNPNDPDGPTESRWVEHQRMVVSADYRRLIERQRPDRR
jgi:hypothetical protein